MIDTFAEDYPFYQVAYDLQSEKKITFKPKTEELVLGTKM